MKSVTSPQIIPEMPICEYVLHVLRLIDNFCHQWLSHSKKCWMCVYIKINKIHFPTTIVPYSPSCLSKVSQGEGESTLLKKRFVIFALLKCQIYPFKNYQHKYRITFMGLVQCSLHRMQLTNPSKITNTKIKASFSLGVTLCWYNNYIWCNCVLQDFVF